MAPKELTPLHKPQQSMVRGFWRARGSRGKMFVSSRVRWCLLGCVPRWSIGWLEWSWLRWQKAWWRERTGSEWAVFLPKSGSHFDRPVQLHVWTFYLRGSHQFKPNVGRYAIHGSIYGKMYSNLNHRTGIWCPIHHPLKFKMHPLEDAGTSMYVNLAFVPWVLQDGPRKTSYKQGQNFQTKGEK